jgi:hypothetical protein
MMSASEVPGISQVEVMQLRDIQRCDKSSPATGVE